ncbi:nuclear factor of activated T-cells, cytoplasmic 1 isoform X2 [Polypterus senegalus]|uniref:nuclear factor of activated T-cells, cytoplasmic 1 isoform X2 n=1 Tax=Polypterus senegalus TaxID=55291 RepID=UPI001966CDBF|nr:nuclear factor of activated T-cells, cytoplasmic 1 isoform X2 [Polypterus senegalus]
MQDNNNNNVSVSSNFALGPLVSSTLAKETLGLHLFSSFSNMKSAEEAFGYTSSNISISLPLGNPCLVTPYNNIQSSPVISVSSGHQATYGGHVDSLTSSYCLPPIRPNGAPALESPRIEITPYPIGLHSQYNQEDEAEESIPSAKRANSIVTLSLPNADNYRDPSCLSPASSLSSRSCNSEASSYESGYSYNYDNSPQNSPWQSPCVSPKGTAQDGLPACTLINSPRHSPSTSPRTSVTDETWFTTRNSRPSSPCGGKRKYSFNGVSYRHQSYSPQHSPTPSPQTSPRVSVTDETWSVTTNQYTNSAIVAAINALSTDSSVDLNDGIPMKSRKTHNDHSPTMSLKVEPGGDDGSTIPSPLDLGVEEFQNSRMPFKKEHFCGEFLSVPQNPYTWSKPKPYISPSLPALDWQLPSCSGPYELQIEVQPKSHHRAHYETEGSRGAVKASAGGHPVVQLHGYMENEPLTLQLFIGTADDRLLRPHAFYQVHRITGKTVSTASHEVMLSNTKVLEIPLLPENNMRAIIDCAGILKLRNSDIELRKGETDIGRKNTRVRMVFRVHISQPNGRTISLQAASNPIECSQRSAQELPLVEKQTLDSFAVTGGKKMVLNGHNFLSDSKVIFVEKAPDGHHVWEMEGKVDKDAFKPTQLLVEIPPYRNQRISSPVQVHFYVCNGKRKRSQYQRFTYLPTNVPIIKTEPTDDYELSPICGPVAPGLSTVSKSFYNQQVLTTLMPSDPSPCFMGNFSSCHQRNTVMLSGSPTLNSNSKLNELSSSAYSKCLSSIGHNQLAGVQQPSAGVPIIQEVPSRAIDVPSSSPDQSSLIMLQPQVSRHLSSNSHDLRQTLYPNSPSSSPVPSNTQEAPYGQAYSPSHSSTSMTQGQQHQKTPQNSPPTNHLGSLPGLEEENSETSLPVTVKREPEELDQMYLDDVNEIIRNDLSSTSIHSHA